MPIQFDIQIKQAGGINKLNLWDGIAKIDNQPIIRLNQDTVHFMGVVDVSEGAAVTLPQTGDRFIYLANQNDRSAYEFAYKKPTRGGL